MNFDTRDALLLAGVACLVGGIFILYGIGWSGVAAGVGLIGLALIAR